LKPAHGLMVVRSSGPLCGHVTGVIFHDWQEMSFEIVIDPLPNHERDSCSRLCGDHPKLLELVSSDEQRRSCKVESLTHDSLLVGLSSYPYVAYIRRPNRQNGISISPVLLLS